MIGVDSLGRATRRDTPLTDNIRQQIAVMREIGKSPSKLKIDPRNWDVLVGELIPSMPMRPARNEPLKVFGLSIEFTRDPDFEVVE